MLLDLGTQPRRLLLLLSAYARPVLDLWNESGSVMLMLFDRYPNSLGKCEQV